MKHTLVSISVFAMLSMCGAAWGSLPSRLNSGGGGINGILVAASDAPPDIKKAAKYICDGVDDQVQINLALTSLATTGGTVYCSAGLYSLSSTVVVPSNVTLEFGNGNKISVTANHALTKYTRYTNYMTPIFTNSDHVKGNTGIRIIGANIDGTNISHSYTGYTTSGWAGIWLDRCSFSEVSDCNIVQISYITDNDEFLAWYANARAYGVLYSDCYKSTIEKCNTEYSGYEGFGLRGYNSFCTIKNCTGFNNRTHVAQMGPWAPSLMGRNKDCVIDGIRNGKNTTFTNQCGDITLHGVPNVFNYESAASTTKTFVLPSDRGDRTEEYIIGETFTVASGDNAGTFTVVSSGYAGGKTSIVVSETVVDDAVGASLTHMQPNERCSVVNCVGVRMQLLESWKTISVMNNQFESFATDVANNCTSSNLLLANNIFKPLTVAGYGMVSCEVGTTASGSSGSMSAITITGNSFSECKLELYGAANSSQYLSDIVISNNSFSVSDSSIEPILISCNGSGNIERVLFSSNNITVTPAGYGVVSFVLTSTGHIQNIDWTANKIYAGHFIRSGSNTGAGKMRYWDIIDNQLYIHDNGTLLQACDNFEQAIIFKNNYILCGTLTSGSSSPTNGAVYFDNNYLSGYGESLYKSGSISDADLIFRNNSGTTLSESYGASTGTGSQQTIAHGLYKTPTIVNISGDASNVSAYQSSSADGANIYITADTGEAYHWEAKVK